ncbi:response regulator [Paenibacillus sp. N3.4]|uniref:response regulator n=1 Tax=Paenibacillus sp. N3.4 TaxID=2603222 RepID=UPI0016509D52|nr:response regulator [Paenibacillus sp. N3.4]
MTKMLVVDDEVWVRERLIHTIDWQLLGITIVDEAGCGYEALEKSKEHNPDIILTDIRMPNMGGLELIQSLKDHQIRAKVIIISGYSDFDYAKKAIALGAFDYVLKPVEDQDLLCIVERCLTQIHAEKLQVALIQKADTQVNKRLPLLKEMLFNKLIQGQIENKQDVRGVLSDFQIYDDQAEHMCILFQVKMEEQVIEQTNKDFVQFVIANVVRDFLRKWTMNEIVFTHSDAIVSIVSSTRDMAVVSQEIQVDLQELNQLVHRILGCSLYIGIGVGCKDIIDISLSYHQAKQSLLYHSYLDKKRKTNTVVCSNWEYEKAEFTESLVNGIKMGHKEAVIAQLNQFVLANSQLTPIEFKFIYVQFIHVLTRTTVVGKESMVDFSTFCLAFLDLLNQLTSVQAMSEFLAKAIEQIMDYLERTQFRKKRKVIEKVVLFMHEHYNEPMNLNGVAERFYINASYLSKIFKEEMHISFSKYLMEYRISRAIELMQDPTKKIYEIASIVGYDDVQYFTKIFKTMKGVTPLNYKEKLI